MKVKIIMKTVDGETKELLRKITGGTIVGLITSKTIYKLILDIEKQYRNKGYYISGIIDADV